MINFECYQKKLKSELVYNNFANDLHIIIHWYWPTAILRYENETCRSHGCSAVAKPEGIPLGTNTLKVGFSECAQTLNLPDEQIRGRSSTSRIRISWAPGLLLLKKKKRKTKHVKLIGNHVHVRPKPYTPAKKKKKGLINIRLGFQVAHPNHIFPKDWKLICYVFLRPRCKKGPKSHASKNKS